MTPVQPLDYAKDHDQLEELKAMDLLEYTDSPYQQSQQLPEVSDLEDIWRIAS